MNRFRRCTVCPNGERPTCSLCLSTSSKARPHDHRSPRPDRGRARAADLHPWRPDMTAGLLRWLRTNLAGLLEGYASALDEVERLRAELRRWQSPCADVGPTSDAWVCPTCRDPKCGDV